MRGAFHLSMKRAAVMLVASTLLVAGCGWDGPSAGVAVIAPTTVAPDGGGDGDPELEMALEAVGDASAGVEESAQASVTAPPSPVSVAPADLPATVAVVGDSLTESASAEITAALEGIGIDVLVVDGAENRRMTHGSDPQPGTASIDDIAAVSAPELWVIALGTNDVGAEVASDQFGDDVETVLDRIPAGAPVVWVDLWIRDRVPAIERANLDLREVVGDRSDSVVADWFSHGDDHGLVTDDGVHLTSDGKHVFAATIVDAVRALSA